MISTSNPKLKPDTRYKILDTSFAFLWRLTIILLPIQARWFSDASLLGWPFEQGRLSFYISWIPLITTIILGFFIPKINLSKKLRTNLFWLIALLGTINIVSTPVDIKATSMWWVQVILLATFFITLLRTKVDLKSIFSWLIIALIPHAIFALAQVFLQYVPGWSWIGVAVQDPRHLGVSVVQTNDLRFLRAYGGFPHPNILGGFMTFGILLSTWLFLLPRKLSNKWSELLILSTIPLFTVALFYSFSRSAWIALAFGFFVLLFLTLIKKDDQKSDWIKTSLPIIAVTATILTFAFINWELTSSRLGLAPEPVRLEQQSVSERSQSLKNGIKVFQAYPILGTGPNSELPALANLTTPFSKGGQGGFAPLEPPHNVFILILANFGISGSLIIFGFLLFLLRQALTHWKIGDPNLRALSIALITSWLVISMFDHYLFSLWSGQFLSITIVFVLIYWLNNRQKDA
jgi:O-Antigen ligase